MYLGWLRCIATFRFFINLRERQRIRDRHQFVVPHLYAFIGWFLCPTGDWNHNLGISGWCSSLWSYLAKAKNVLLLVVVVVGFFGGEVYFFREGRWQCIIISYDPGMGTIGILQKGPRRVSLGLTQYLSLKNYHVSGMVLGTREKNYKIMSVCALQELAGSATCHYPEWWLRGA